MNIIVRALKTEDFPRLIPFADRFIGTGYFKITDAEQILSLSTNSDGVCASLVLVDQQNPNDILGLRISYSPGRWLAQQKMACQTDLWPVPSESVAYFKSLFIHQSLRGKKWGPKLSRLSADILRQQGAKVIVCHAWKESPDNSSVRYLTKFGFKPIAEIPYFWYDVDYLCSGCQQKPCICTAVEMIYQFDEENDIDKF